MRVEPLAERRLPKTMSTVSVKVPTIPKGLVTVATALGSLGAAGAATLSAYPQAPAWAVYLLSALASIAAFLSGQAAPAFTLPGGPLVPIALVPVLLSVSASAAAAASTVQGWQSGALLLCSSLAAGLAGKAGPQQAVPVSKQGGA